MYAPWLVMTLIANSAIAFASPVVVTGFEPVDLATGILACVEQLEAGRCEVENCYNRSVRPSGNPHAVQLVNQVFEACDRQWRGLGMMPLGGMCLREAWRHFDAEYRFNTSPLAIPETVAVVAVTSCVAESSRLNARRLAGNVRPSIRWGRRWLSGEGCVPPIFNTTSPN